MTVQASQNARRWRRLLAAVAVVGALGTAPARPVAGQDGYQRISGEGSSWAANSIDAMRVNVRQFGITVDYNPSGSTSGRKNFLNGTVDFAASDIPFQFEPEDGSASENPAPGSYAYIPVTAGGTAFIYNLVVNGQQVTNLRLSGENVTKIFTGAITTWNDPALQADNPGLQLPARPIVPVVRSDGSGSSAQFTQWMIAKHGAIWDDYCNRSGRAPACGFTSFYPTVDGMIAQAGDVGVAGYVSQSFAEGAIGYVNYSYALGVEFPVAKVLNEAGFYTEPTPENVAVSLLQARINEDAGNPALYLTQELGGVYNDTDPRSYQLSSYSYFILPTTIAGQFNEAKGRTLGAFAYYAMCQAQQQSASLGYSPLPINLVDKSLEQIRKIPGVEVQSIDIAQCDNPTFSTDGTNTLAENAPRPPECDRVGQFQCPDGTAGKRNQPTTLLPSAVLGAPPASGSGGTTTGGATSGGATSGGATSGGATSGGATSGGATSGGATSGGATSGGATSGGATSGGATSGGATSGGATTSGATAGGETTGGATAGDAAEMCDPDTGICVASAAGVGFVGSAEGGVQQVPQANAAVAAPIQAVTLDQGTGWGRTQVLIVLIALLTLGIVLAPALAGRYFTRRTA